VFDLPLELVDGALRDRAKAVNYGLAYGLTPFGLGQQLGIPPDEAQEIVDAYFERFPKVRSFLDAAVNDARRDGYTTTMFGRRRYLPDLLSDNRNRRQMAERMALNAPIQGTAADVIKLAMIRLQAALDRSGLRTQLLLQVHDEVILEVPEDELDAARELVVDELAGSPSWPSRSRSTPRSGRPGTTPRSTDEPGRHLEPELLELGDALVGGHPDHVGHGGRLDGLLGGLGGSAASAVSPPPDRRTTPPRRGRRRRPRRGPPHRPGSSTSRSSFASGLPPSPKAAPPAAREG
jgi:hypothetical protein